MPTEVLYRKWRPQRFADVSGQEIVKRTLLNALAGGKVSHAYLFSGPRGTGKTTMGRLLTKAINCEKTVAAAGAGTSKGDGGGEPCNECPSCVAFSEGRALDLVELDGASNRGIDDIRDLRDKVGYAPMGGERAHKVYLIDEVHMLTDQAFNALLKTIEEPPPHIVFILATTDAHKVPATIISRCQRQDFKRIPLAAIVDRLAYIAAEEGIDVPRDGLELIARNATGSLRDAINLLEQICDSYGKDASLEAVREGLGLVADERATLVVADALRGDLAGALTAIASVRDDGHDLKRFQKDVVNHLRDLLLVQAGAAGDNVLTSEQIDEMRASIDGVTREQIVRLLKLLNEADLRLDPLSPLPLELAIAESLVAPAAETPAARPGMHAPPDRPAARPAPPTRAPDRPQQRSVAPPAQRPAPQDRVPADLRKDNITGASAEEIARMVGSRAPVIPPAADAPPEAPPAANGAAKPANGNGAAQPPADATASADAPPADPTLDTLVDRMYALVRTTNRISASFLAGSGHALSFEDGVLTIGAYAPFHKGKIEQAEHRKLYEEAAATLLGAPVSIRCIIVERPAKKPARSPLVQHAVENHGAKIVSED